jgi:uncharacterized protein (TIGR00255 family)
MLRSMTGYGEAKLEDEQFVLAIELKSVNNRFLKISGKVPEEVSYLLNELEGQIRKSLLRGSVSFTLRFEPKRSADLYEIDEDLLKKYLKTLTRINTELKTDEALGIKDLLLLPGVIHTEEALHVGKEEVLAVARRTLEATLEGVIKMRSLEGARLEEEFRVRIHKLKSLLETVKRDAARAVEEYQQKLEERVNHLLSEKGVKLDPEDLLKEVAILAERSDIAEETQRLESHLEQFVETIGESVPVGRKLEFIVQEMLRESNTMGAKSPSSSLSRSTVEIKAEVDRLKEQVVNVE